MIAPGCAPSMRRGTTRAAAGVLVGIVIIVLSSGCAGPYLFGGTSDEGRATVAKAAKETVPYYANTTAVPATAMAAGVKGKPAGPFWNLWAESGRYQPVTPLLPDRSYTVQLHLSSIDYQASLDQATPTIGATLDAWLKNLPASMKSVYLTAVLVADRDHFIRVKDRVRTFEVDLNRARAAFAGRGAGATDEKAFDRLARGDSPFVLGQLTEPFHLTTRSRSGVGTVAVSFWTDQKVPIEEAVFNLCIRAPDDSVTKCDEPVAATVQRNLRFSSPTDEADASFHFVQLHDEAFVAVAKLRGQKEFLSWTVDKPIHEVMRTLGRAVKAFDTLATAQGMAARGRELAATLFPPQESEGVRRELDELIRRGTKAKDAADTPRVFVRLLENSDKTPILVPLGLMTFGDQGQHLGFAARIETPLPIAGPDPPATCMRRWILFVPREDGRVPNEEQFVLPELMTARRQANAELSRYERDAEPKGSVSFKTWAGQVATAGEAPVALLTLSHNDVDALYLHLGSKIYRDDFTRALPAPSLAILAGCGTGDPLDPEWIEKLNANGARMVIGTVTSIAPELAGAYVDLLLACIESSTDGEAIGVCHQKAVLDVRDKTFVSGTTNVAFGPRALAFSAVGDTRLRVCAPGHGE